MKITVKKVTNYSDIREAEQKIIDDPMSSSWIEIPSKKYAEEQFFFEMKDLSQASFSKEDDNMELCVSGLFHQFPYDHKTYEQVSREFKIRTEKSWFKRVLMRWRT